MDGHRFDDWTRSLTASASRRTALQTITGIVAGAIALRQATADAAVCREFGEICFGDKQCCSDRCRAGRCDCLRRRAPCRSNRDCCTGRCRKRRTCS